MADCPNAQPALERVTAALAGRDAEVELVEVADETEAARLGMYGSPTILIDGTDLFALPRAVPSLSCRLYRAADGTVSGAPDETALRQALAGAATPGQEFGVGQRETASLRLPVPATRTSRLRKCAGTRRSCSG
ncbi:hypothetical protein [Streptomyces sp. NPDC048496]|uniref:hypothetical protein n=1 Tax=Streptomyces sp. NPDC048496 TaxID=3365558 RepID=UPI00371B3B1C